MGGQFPSVEMMSWTQLVGQLGEGGGRRAGQGKALLGEVQLKFQPRGVGVEFLRLDVNLDFMEGPGGERLPLKPLGAL